MLLLPPPTIDVDMCAVAISMIRKFLVKGHEDVATYTVKAWSPAKDTHRLNSLSKALLKFYTSLSAYQLCLTSLLSIGPTVHQSIAFGATDRSISVANSRRIGSVTPTEQL